ncbi:MAG: Rpn family recombination-promoting nuclease/putative transposase [Alphaproteobacteria bacterium]|jgi:predicted transposase/invertase (TIGR01784 family)|nr:Rpn family recombination-promoting nuclease/putative transposase [Alphaproteobacteria bacterium]MBT5390242.1 Rpn family recombination-promoting nuclease/putative transposase [Alphaproteobacteria bacterium]MBT5540813.1 Rpn family recombination-promoting nuclease/putative transposase [Alphaproteobacteria bacterium]MBT5655163.1 Rpn family recombination-promoting nuclease/putative transposase [Alphaproteobacteria bacterium]
MSYASQLGKGVSYFQLRPVVVIAITNHDLFTDSKDYISYHRTLNEKTHTHHMKDISYVFVELTKFNKTRAELKTVEDKWLYLFKNASDEKSMPSQIIEKEIIDAYETLEVFNWNRYQYMDYISAEIALTDEYRRQQVRFEEGQKEGEEIGVKKVRLAIFNKLKEQGYSATEILNLTGLTEKEHTEKDCKESSS